MRAIGFIIHLALALVQLFAIMAGIEHWFGLSKVFAGIIGFLIAGIPLVGAIAGYVGATEVWGWAWWQAGPLFFGGLLLTIVVGAGSVILERFGRA